MKATGMLPVVARIRHGLPDRPDERPEDRPRPTASPADSRTRRGRPGPKSRSQPAVYGLPSLRAGQREGPLLKAADRFEFEILLESVDTIERPIPDL